MAIRSLRNSGVSLRGFIKDLPEALSTGKLAKGKLLKIRNLFWATFTHEFYTLVHREFLVKSKGGTDITKVKWKPLTKETKAYRSKKGLSNVLSKRKKEKGKTKGLLTAKQTAIWKGIYSSNFGRLAATIGEGPAKAKSAQIAWGIVKSKYGGKTKLSELGDREVPILIRSGRLLKSFAPGKLSSNRYYPSKDQIYNHKGGRLELGTRVPYAEKQDKERPLWGNADELIEQALEKALEKLVKQGRL
jgi:hypothetical protein|tara:strand:- start:2654 stop:3391 length:738 start_codon:yes stop_codon:yes gene_type:complete